MSQFYLNTDNSSNFLTKPLVSMFSDDGIEISLINIIGLLLAFAFYYVFLRYFRRRLRKFVPDSLQEIKGNKIPLYKIFKQSIAFISILIVVFSFDINNEHFSITELLQTSIVGNSEEGGFHLNISHIVGILMAFYISRILIAFLKFILKRRSDLKDDVDQGSTYVILTVAKYLIYLIIIVIFVQTTGANMTFLLTSSAAIFLAISWAIQDFLKDVFSGFILLFDGSIRVGDQIVINSNVESNASSQIVQVKKISIRTTKVLNTNGNIVILPNQFITKNPLSNYTTNSKANRFKVEFSVAYGQDIEKVKQLLEPELIKFKFIKKSPKPFIKVEKLGNNGLELVYLFWSIDMWRYEYNTGLLNQKIYETLNSNNIEIPYPQLTIHQPIDSNNTAEK
jgi:small-conductance mechanosensitive channel